MPSEQLVQDGYIRTEIGLKGLPFGKFEELSLGSTKVNALIKAGVNCTVPSVVNFPFKKYKPTKTPGAAQPDKVYILRNGSNPPNLRPVAVAEYKLPAKLKGDDAKLYTSEQALHSAVAMGVKFAVATDGSKNYYVDVDASLNAGVIVYVNEIRSFNPAVLDELLAGGCTVRDPGELSERVWQLIWHATKEEPKPCLLTFVEIFILKFLSDNLPKSILPHNLSFYELIIDNADFKAKHGCTQIEHYISMVRPKIKQIFPDNTVCQDSTVGSLFGLGTIVSKTSIINGFSFLRNSISTAPVTYNRVFVEILKEFHVFGPLSLIDPEFKLRLYETFLKKTARQQKLGQFFTPRNVVRSIIRMAQLNKLPEGAVVLDPACGVGGFILEPALLVEDIKDNLFFQSGKPKRKIKLLGADVDASTHILAKANLLLHHVEAVRDISTTTQALNALMAETFLLLNDNETLGTLEHPPVASVDLIMTNPPYVTQGSKVYKDEIKSVQGVRNGQILSEYYTGAGLGLESLFLRYISGALKPGGRAYVIVPQGMLTRTETGTKELVLEECNLLASIALPRNTFFNTPQKTYILTIEKRHTPVDPRPDVFCAIVRSIGESLDSRRVPTPDDNDLEYISTEFIKFDNAKVLENVPFIKIISPDRFTKEDRWDSARFWTNDELVDLGALDPAISRNDFIDEALSQIEALKEDLILTQEEINSLIQVPSNTVLIGQEELVKEEEIDFATGDIVAEAIYEPLFIVRRGKRVTRKDCDLNPGDSQDLENLPIPVYSGSKDPARPLGTVGAKWLKSRNIPIETRPIVTVNANGYVGAVFVRREPCVIHDDVMIIIPTRNDIDLDFLAQQLRSAIAEGNFEYEAKLYSRVKELRVKIPLDDFTGGFDKLQQMEIANAIKKFDSIRSKLKDIGFWAGDARMKDE